MCYPAEICIAMHAISARCNAYLCMLVLETSAGTLDSTWHCETEAQVSSIHRRIDMDCYTCVYMDMYMLLYDFYMYV